MLHHLSVLPKVLTLGQPLFQDRKPSQKLRMGSRATELWAHVVDPAACSSQVRANPWLEEYLLIFDTTDMEQLFS